MGTEITIGGNRLGSGKKMKQYLHNYERSNHNLDTIWRSTMSPGTLVPFLSEPMLPGDTFDIKLAAEVLTHPTIGPLFGNFKFQLDLFIVPIRLYQAQLHNNKLGIGMDMSKIKLPQIEIECNNIDLNSSIPIDSQQISRSSLLNHLDIKGVGRSYEGNPTVKRNFNAISYLGYYDIFKNYYSNKQETNAYIIDYEDITPITFFNSYRILVSSGAAINLPAQFDGTGNYALRVFTSAPDTSYMTIVYSNTSGGAELKVEWDKANLTNVTKVGHYYQAQIYGNSILNGKYIIRVEQSLSSMIINQIPKLKEFPLENIDTMREDILHAIKNTSPFKITKLTYSPYGDNLKPLTNGVDGMIRSLLPQQGILLKTYQSDKYNNWLKNETVDGINGIAEVTAVAITDNKLKLDTLNLSQKVYNMLNRIYISGGTYNDWIGAVYSEAGINSIETPIYIGGLSKEIAFQEVVSNSATENEPLGTIGGRGVFTNKNKGGNIYAKVQEPSYIMGIVSITPRIDYSQGNIWHSTLETMNDFHKPALDGIGFQDLVTDEMAAWDTKIDQDGNITYQSAGKSVAWLNYMTNVNKTYGGFAEENNQMFMTLNRRYQPKNAMPPEYQPISLIKDLTTYIDPSNFNYAFAQTSINAQNFWVQIAIDIDARRKMSARQIPNL